MNVKSTAADATSALYSALEQFRADLRAREAGAVSVMSDAWEFAEEAIAARLDALEMLIMKAGEDGTEISEAWLLGQARYQALLRQIDTEIQLLATTTAGALTERQRQFVEAGVNHAEALTATVLGPAPDGVGVQWNRVPTLALQNLVGFASDGSPLATLIAEIGTGDAEGTAALSAQVREALISGIAAGDGPRETARAMRRGAEAKLSLGRARAESIARTETMRAYREAARQTYAANPDVARGWIWTATLDARTCASCWAMHGSLHDVTAILDDHINGRCVAVPKTPTWAELTGDASIPETAPVIEPGADQFAKLSAARQREILGPGLHDLYQAGEIALIDCSQQDSNPRWGTMRRRATVEEAKANAEARKAK